MKAKSCVMKLQKTVGFIVIAVVFSSNLLSQSYIPTKQDLDQFFKTKTLVVLEDNPLLQYNINIRKVIAQHWNITEYDFISFSDFEKKRNDPQYSFLLMTQVTFEKDKLLARYNFLQVLLGKDVLRVNQMPEICSVPLSYEGVYEDYYVYKLGTLVRFCQKHILMLKDNPNVIGENVFKHYNDNIGDIHSKTLYVVEDELAKEVNSLARIKKVYPYKVRIATREEIEKVIEDEDPNAVFLHKVGPEGTRFHARCYNIVIGAADANFYYFDYHMINSKNPDGLLESDFKKMAKDR